MIGLGALFPASGITAVICFCATGDIPTYANLIIGLTIFSTIMIAAAALAVSITNKLEVKDLQNPKDWKDIALGQKTSEKEGYSQKTTDTLTNRTSAANKPYTISI